MKALKIETKNSASIEAALRTVNGTAHAHTYTEFSQIEAIAQRAESQVCALLGSKKDSIGATFTSESGASVAGRYNVRRLSTTVTLVRKKGGWFLTEVGGGALYTAGGGTRLILTRAQDARAIEQLRQTYTCK